MKKLETDILIIGGGPAGSTTAIYLSQLGYDITVIEKKNFPRETLCGEFLSKEVTEVLKDINTYDNFLSLRPNRLKTFKAIDKSGLELKSDLSFEAFAMKRSVFDLMLLNKALEKKVKVIQPAEVISTVKQKDNFISEVQFESSEKIKVYSRIVIAAYGKQNIFDKKLERTFISKKSYLNGLKFHLPISYIRDPFPDEIRIYTDEGIYCGMNQVNDSEITICFLENRKKSKIPSRERLIEAIKTNNYFKNVFYDNINQYLISANVYGTGNIYFGKKNVVENGIIMVGDSARVISPLAGDGIGMALESAKLLFEVMKDNLRNINLNKISLLYQKKYEQIFANRLRTAKILQSIILNDKYRKVGFKFVDKYPALLPYLIKFTRSSKTD